MIFNGNVTVANIVTFAQNYGLSFLGNSYTFSTPVTFNNTGNLALGNNAADVFNFNAGFSRLVGTTTLGGTINTTNNAFTLGAVQLAANTVINAGAGAISLGSVSGAFGLNVTSSLSKTLNGVINIASLSTNGAGTTTINTGAITTVTVLPSGGSLTTGSRLVLMLEN